MTPDLAKDPKTVAKAFVDMQESLARASEAARSNPYNAVSIFNNQQLTNGVPVTLSHGLGVPYKRIEIVMAHTGSGPMIAVELASPTGANKSQTCTFIPYGSACIVGAVRLVSGTAIVSTAPLGYDFVTVALTVPVGTLGAGYKVFPSIITKGWFLITSVKSDGTTQTLDTSHLSYMYTKLSSGTYDILISG